MLAAAALLPATAAASPNNAPSNAVNVQLGVPFSGNWPGTVYVHGQDPSHWWRMPSVLRAGDQVQVAVDNRQGVDTLYVCLVPAIDDFGADAAFENCASNSSTYRYFSSGQQSRDTLTYDGPSGQGFLVTWFQDCCPSRGESVASGDGGQYSATIERITTLVNIGLAVPPTLPASFLLTASMVYGDNTPVANGTPAVLQWRPVAVKGTDPVPFANLVYSSSVAGIVTFAGTMPPEVQGQKVQLRACAAQPGSDGAKCAASARTLVAESACSKALRSQLAWSRVVHRLARRVRHHRPGPAKLRLRRKLKAKRHKLAKANDSVKAHCP